MVEKKAKMNSVINQASLLFTIIKSNSDTDILNHADDFLLFLNHLSDASKKHHQLDNLVNSVNDIVHDLESNPEQTLQRLDVRERLSTLFKKLLQKGGS